MSAENNPEQLNENTVQQSSSGLDFVKMYKDLLKHKKLYYKVLPITFVLAAIYALSLPNYYECTVKLSPEMSSSRSSSGLAALASNFGFNLGQGTGGMGTEALFPTLYPDLVNSTDFKITLFPVPVTIEGDREKGIKDRTMSYYDYLSNEQKKPWFSAVFAAPGKLIGWLISLFKDKPQTATIRKLDPFRLTKEQANIVKAIDKKVVCDVDKKTMVITISVTDQNPVICATMADSVKTRLQKFITDYRTSKVRVDLAIRQENLCRDQGPLREGPSEICRVHGCQPGHHPADCPSEADRFGERDAAPVQCLLTDSPAGGGCRGQGAGGNSCLHGSRECHRSCPQGRTFSCQDLSGLPLPRLYGHHRLDSLQGRRPHGPLQLR